MRICDRAVRDIPRGIRTYQSNGNTAESGSYSKSFVGLGCSVTIRGKDLSWKDCKITGDALKVAHEDIKAGERGNCEKRSRTKVLGYGCSVSIEYTQGCSNLKRSTMNYVAMNSGELGEGQSLNNGFMYRSMTGRLLG